MKVEKYSALARGYDNFMEEIPYARWTEWIRKSLVQNGIEDGLVCDLGCGSGIITTALADLGYDMIGIDSSFEMLSIAREKKEERDILYLDQDIREFELYGTVRAIIATCDVLNYMTDNKDLEKILALAHNYLDPDGIFIFDLHTGYYYSNICAGNTFTAVDEDGAYIWENSYDEASCINEYNLTLFEKSYVNPNDTELYERYEEYHEEKAYEIVYIKQMAEKAGFRIISVKDGYSDKDTDEKTCRAVFIIQKCR